MSRLLEGSKGLGSKIPLLGANVLAGLRHEASVDTRGVEAHPGLGRVSNTIQQRQ